MSSSDGSAGDSIQGTGNAITLVCHQIVLFANSTIQDPGDGGVVPPRVNGVEPGRRLGARMTGRVGP